MKFDSLVSLVGDLEWFDFATVAQLTGERRATIANQLSRMARAGKVVSLRRGLYALAPHYRRVAIQPASLGAEMIRTGWTRKM
jgi:hypothetical protein